MIVVVVVLIVVVQLLLLLDFEMVSLSILHVVEALGALLRPYLLVVMTLRYSCITWTSTISHSSEHGSANRPLSAKLFGN